jgi:hypothetical protein
MLGGWIRLVVRLRIRLLSPTGMGRRGKRWWLIGMGMMILRIRRIGTFSLSLNNQFQGSRSRIDYRWKQVVERRKADNQVISQEIMARLVYHVDNYLCLYRFLNLLSSNRGRSGLFWSKRISLSTRSIIIWYVHSFPLMLPRSRKYEVGKEKANE